MVIWLLGLSGSGKTTIGRKLKETFDQEEIPNYMIDGDEARSFFSHDLGYSIEDRKANLKRILYGAHVLSKANVATIVCNISPWEDVREFARESLDEYNEIYINCGIEECIKRDPKGVYKRNMGKTDIIGLEIEFEIPKNPDLILSTKVETCEESVSKLVSYVSEKYPNIKKKIKNKTPLHINKETNESHNSCSR